MSALVQVFVKPNCEKSLKALEMVAENGGIDDVVFFGEIDKEMAKYSNDAVSQINEDADILAEFKKEGLELPVVMFDSWTVGYDELLEAYETEELNGYFT
ncbi:hypothetical protein [Faucicola boevrei]|uniref:hypothetical protein n=1 Tax=Faucicola boevrei TaxID=346665 RepID=UPI000377EAF0|nr:hypothetical protein [Moraxella boevrei]